MKITFLFVLLFITGAFFAQEPSRRFEFGSTVLTMNSYNTSNSDNADRPALEIMNGLFFRYTKNKFALRVFTSYSDNAGSATTFPSMADGSTNDWNRKDFRVGAGAQYSILRNRDWLYTFLDGSYRSVFSTGHYYGGIWGSAEKYTSSSNGIDLFLGLGFKLQVLKNICLSPEIGLYNSTNFIDKTSTSLYSGQVSNYNYTENYLNPVAKLHLTVKF